MTKDSPRNLKVGIPEEGDTPGLPLAAEPSPILIRALDPPPVAANRFIAATLRRFVDESFIEWTVVEIEAGSVPGSRGERCLLFTRNDCIRRVWVYPADWCLLDAAGLIALSWHR